MRPGVCDWITVEKVMVHGGWHDTEPVGAKTVKHRYVDDAQFTPPQSEIGPDADLRPVRLLRSPGGSACGSA